jgi:hypothetical protein
MRIGFAEFLRTNSAFFFFGTWLRLLLLLQLVRVVIKVVFAVVRALLGMKMLFVAWNRVVIDLANTILFNLVRFLFSFIFVRNFPRVLC